MPMLEHRYFFWDVYFMIPFLQWPFSNSDPFQKILDIVALNLAGE